jgi:Uma2 family endonuclease
MQTEQAYRPIAPHQERLTYRRITVDQYYRMAEVGLLKTDERVELVGGVIIDMGPAGSGHAGALRRLNRLLTGAIGTRAILTCQLPVQLSRFSEPQPDLAVLRPRDDFYEAKRPRAEDALLVIEVSVTSARYDREVKIPLYARHLIPEVWTVDLNDGTLLVHRGPDGAVYTDVVELTAPGIVELAELPRVQVDLSEFLRT